DVRPVVKFQGGTCPRRRAVATFLRRTDRAGIDGAHLGGRSDRRPDRRRSVRLDPARDRAGAVAGADSGSLRDMEPLDLTPAPASTPIAAAWSHRPRTSAGRR